MINETRRLHTILISEKLQETHARLTEEGNHQALEDFAGLVRAGRYGGVKMWAEKHQHLDLTELPVAQLRTVAASYGIYKYYRKSKIELIQEIRYAKERPRLCKYCHKRHPELACQDQNAEFDI